MKTGVFCVSMSATESDMLSLSPSESILVDCMPICFNGLWPTISTPSMSIVSECWAAAAAGSRAASAAARSVRMVDAIVMAV